MAYAWRSKWLDWKPGDANISVYPKAEPAKPAEPPFAGFAGSIPGDSQIISSPADDPEAWREAFYGWTVSECAFKDRCFGGIGCLHVHFCEWADAHNAVPCTRETFEQLLSDAGFLHADGFVSGLILREDWEASRWKPPPPKAQIVPKPRKNGGFDDSHRRL